MRYGRLPHDPQRLAGVAPHLAIAAAKPIERSGRDFRPFLGYNNQAPTCTSVGVFNDLQASNWIRNDSALAIQEDFVLPFYAKCAGCPNTLSDIEATNGVQLLSVLQRAEVYGVDVGLQTTYVPTYWSVNINSLDSMLCSLQSGPLYLGGCLAKSDQPSGLPWDVGSGEYHTPSVELGHCFMLWDAPEPTFNGVWRIATWGYLQVVTGAWLLSRLNGQEGFALDWKQLG